MYIWFVVHKQTSGWGNFIFLYLGTVFPRGRFVRGVNLFDVISNQYCFSASDSIDLSLTRRIMLLVFSMSDLRGFQGEFSYTSCPPSIMAWTELVEFAES